MVMRKGQMLGHGQGYYNYKPMAAYDKRVHSESAMGRKQPQQMPFMPINPALRQYSNEKLQEGAIKEHIEHPEFSMEQARMIARDHLRDNPRAYGKAVYINHYAKAEAMRITNFDGYIHKVVDDKTKMIIGYEEGSTFSEESIHKIHPNLKTFVFVMDDGQEYKVKALNKDVAKLAIGYGTKYQEEWGDSAGLIDALKKGKATILQETTKYKDLGGKCKGGYLMDTRYDSRKSFYGKADVRQEGNKLILKSYSTDVAYIEDGKPVVKGTYSPTTLRHIKEFLLQNGFKADNSKQILKDYKPDIEPDVIGGKLGNPKVGYKFVDNRNPHHIEFIKLPQKKGQEITDIEFEKWVKAVEERNDMHHDWTHPTGTFATSTKGGKGGKKKLPIGTILPSYKHIKGERIRKGANYFMGDRIKKGNWSDKRWARARHKDNAQVGKKYEDWEKSKYQRWK